MNTRSVSLPLMRQTRALQTPSMVTFLPSVNGPESRRDRLAGKRGCEMNRAADTYAAQRLAQRSRAAIGGAGNSDIARGSSSRIWSSSTGLLKPSGITKRRAWIFERSSTVPSPFWNAENGMLICFQPVKLSRKEALKDDRFWLGLVEAHIVD